MIFLFYLSSVLAHSSDLLLKTLALIQWLANRRTQHPLHASWPCRIFPSLLPPVPTHPLFPVVLRFCSFVLFSQGTHLFVIFKHRHCQVVQPGPLGDGTEERWKNTLIERCPSFGHYKCSSDRICCCSCPIGCILNLKKMHQFCKRTLITG